MQKLKRMILRRLIRMLHESEMRPVKQAPGAAHGAPTEFAHADWKNFIRHDAMLNFFAQRGLLCRNAYDVGAYQGKWSEWTRRRFPEARLYLFEAIEEQYANLRRVCSSLGNAELITHGLSDKPEEREITLWPSLSGSSVLPVRGQRFDHLPRRLIQLESIDHLVEAGRLPIPEIVKLDVQGHELAVLKGATSLFGKTDVFIAECSLHRYFGQVQPLAYEIWDFMRENGYELFDICGTYRRPVDHALDQFDMVYLRRDSPLHKAGPLTGRHEFDW